VGLFNPSVEAQGHLNRPKSSCEINHLPALRATTQNLLRAMWRARAAILRNFPDFRAGGAESLHSELQDGLWSRGAGTTHEDALSS
jgi:hypothetical protein